MVHAVEVVEADIDIVEILTPIEDNGIEDGQIAGVEVLLQTLRMNQHRQRKLVLVQHLMDIG